VPEEQPAAHVVLAPDKFKGSLTGPEVAEALARGLRRVRPGVPVRLAPVADGGDGTVDAALAAGFTRHTATVQGPTGAPVEAVFAVRDGLAVIETAAACGLSRLPGGLRAPLTASSHGAGELVTAALDAGCHTVVLGVGGSASTDGGAGLLVALGARLTDAEGSPLAPGGAALADLAEVDLATLDDRLDDVTVVLAADVDNPLLGKDGAAAVFGPQKGVLVEDLPVVENALARYGDLVQAATGVDPATPGAGAAGGTGFGLLAWGATIERGSAAVGAELGLPREVAGADVVLTGEGRYDDQSEAGKVPAYVRGLAAASGVRCGLVAGLISSDASAFDAAVSLTALAGSSEDAMERPRLHLVAAGAALARALS
jgi:glycerate 2-kinase